MTTNQTIDGVLVSRELLERVLVFGIDAESGQVRMAAFRELRALLDAPAVERKPFGYWRVPKSFPLQGVFLPWIEGQSEQDVKNSLEHEFGFSVQLLYDTPAAQSQGEPVAYLDESGKFVFIGYEKLRTACWVDGNDRAIPDAWKPLYAEQPAPVAVVLPERKRAHCTGAISDFRTWEEAQGWNACLDELKRLNPSL